MDQADWQRIKGSPFLGVLPDDVVQSLIDGPLVRVFEKGAPLFSQGDPAQHCYFILDGWVKIFRSTAQGTETVVHIFRPGELFAEAVMFMGGRYPVSAETVTQCRLVRFNGQKLRQQIGAKPQLALGMLASASQHLKVLVSQVENMKRLSTSQRLADFLLSLCGTASGATRILLPYEKALIAGRLGMKPESLSRSLARLKPLGVTVERDEVVISDLDKLRAFAEADIETE